MRLLTLLAVIAASFMAWSTFSPAQATPLCQKVGLDGTPVTNPTMAGYCVPYDNAAFCGQEIVTFTPWAGVRLDYCVPAP
jgi:hypothetical protein